MFGYVRADTGELRVREYAYYRMAYCGLCKSIKHHISPFFTLTLSYDFVFLALVRMILSDTAGESTPRRCAANPFRKRPVMEDNPALSYAADASAILFYHSVRDNIADERGGKRLLYRMIGLPAKHWYKKAMRHGDYALLDTCIRTQLNALAALEASGESSPDAAAEPFGILLGALFAHGFASTDARIAESIGRHIGRYIYIADAADDVPRDAENGSYNPLLLCARGAALPPADWLRNNREALALALTMEATEAYRAVTLSPHWDAHPACPCVENILLGGLPKTAEHVLNSPGKPLSQKDISL